MVAPSDLRPLDPRVWRSCAGSSSAVPSLHSRVYYFPQGHLEHASSSGANLLGLKPHLLCRVSDLHLLADPVSDEVFAKLLLAPVDPHSPPPPEAVVPDSSSADGVVSFAKVLTPSDANNGGGFSVPRFCADSIFPPLDHQADPPVQTLSVSDVHGAVWDFRHIYRGTPRRHLLTTGWSRFVNHKKLVAGDSVVFVKGSRGDVSVGVRRAVREGRYGFSGKVSAEAVVEAAELAARGLPFEVVYYPRAGWSEFVVKSEVVEESLGVYWSAGMRVKMAMETDDSSRMAWFQGTVSSAPVGGGLWQGSPWRMLEITWDEPEVLQNSRRVSPWQVEFVAPTPPIHTYFPPAKKFRIPQSSGSLNDGGDLFFPMGRISGPTMFSHNTYPAGMQGARQIPSTVSSSSNLLSFNTSQMFAGKFSGTNMVPNLKTVSTELNIGSPQSDNLSPDSQSSVLSFGTELSGNISCNTEKVGVRSFQLFGKVIHMKQPADSNFEDVNGCAEDNGSKGCSEMGGSNNKVGLSLTFPYTKLLDRLDGQCQRASTVEACPIS